MTKAVTPWDQLAEPFPAEVVKSRPGPGGRTLSYIDARIVAQRLDDVLTPEGWDFQAQSIGGDVVHGRLVIFSGERAVTREDFGYPNGDDDAEPIKSAASDALKRCAVQVGVGRHLYSDNKAQATSAPVARLGPSYAPTGDGSWVCPVHGGGRVKGNRRGLYCATKLDDGSWCPHTDSERPIEPRPKPADTPPEPPSFNELPF